MTGFMARFMARFMQWREYWTVSHITTSYRIIIGSWATEKGCGWLDSLIAYDLVHGIAEGEGTKELAYQSKHNNN